MRQCYSPGRNWKCVETLLVVIAIRGYARCPLPRALDANGLENVEESLYS